MAQDVPQTHRTELPQTHPAVALTNEPAENAANERHAMVKLVLIKTNEESLQCVIVEQNGSFLHTSQPSITELWNCGEIFPPEPRSQLLVTVPDRGVYSVPGESFASRTCECPNVNEPIKDCRCNRTRHSLIGSRTDQKFQKKCVALASCNDTQI